MVKRVSETLKVADKVEKKCRKGNPLDVQEMVPDRALFEPTLFCHWWRVLFWWPRGDLRKKHLLEGGSGRWLILSGGVARRTGPHRMAS